MICGRMPVGVKRVRPCAPPPVASETNSCCIAIVGSSNPVSSPMLHQRPLFRCASKVLEKAKTARAAYAPPGAKTPAGVR
jgi:hypothetical protein